MIDPAVKAIVARRRVMAKVQKACDKQGLPYPPELIEYLTDVRRFRSVD